MISKKTGKEVIPHFATDKDVNGALDRYRTDIKKEFSEILKESVAELEQVTENIEKGALEVPVVNLTSYILRNAYESNASDIHIEPHEKLSLLRYRIDGVMHDIASLPRNVHDLLVARLKILAKLKTDEHFLDGVKREEALAIGRRRNLFLVGISFIIGHIRLFSFPNGWHMVREHLGVCFTLERRKVKKSLPK